MFCVCACVCVLFVVVFFCVFFCVFFFFLLLLFFCFFLSLFWLIFFFLFLFFFFFFVFFFFFFLFCFVLSQCKSQSIQETCSISGSHPISTLSALIIRCITLEKGSDLSNLQCDKLSQRGNSAAIDKREEITAVEEAVSTHEDA